MYFQVDYYLPKKAAPLMFFKCLALDYSIHRGEFAYCKDQISHTILFNDVKHERVIEQKTRKNCSSTELLLFA